MDDIIDGKKSGKPTLSIIENHVIILPTDTKIEPIIEEYIYRSQYFVEYLLDNNGRLDGFIHHTNNMYVLKSDYDIRKQICEQLYEMYKSHDFIWCNQSSLFKHMRGYLPEFQYNNKTREIIDDNYPRALQWCSADPQSENLVSLDIYKCYPSILINNKELIPLYTIHEVIEPFSEDDLRYNYGEYYIDEYVFNSWAKGIKIEAGFYSRRLVQMLIDGLRMPTNYVKYFIRSRKTLAPDTFKNFLLKIFELESQAKLLAH